MNEDAIGDFARQIVNAGDPSEPVVIYMHPGWYVWTTPTDQEWRDRITTAFRARYAETVRRRGGPAMIAEGRAI
jgi:hypothetical protein